MLKSPCCTFMQSPHTSNPASRNRSSQQRDVQNLMRWNSSWDLRSPLMLMKSFVNCFAHEFSLNCRSVLTCNTHSLLWIATLPDWFICIHAHFWDEPYVLLSLVTVDCTFLSVTFSIKDILCRLNSFNAWYLVFFLSVPFYFLFLHYLL